MHKRRAVWVLAGVALWLPARADAQTMISIGSCRKAPGTTFTVPIDVTAPSPMAALNVRLRYDPTFLSLVDISGGALMSPSHEVHYSTPADGEVNIVVYSPTGTTPFTASSGTAVALTFAPNPRARAGHATKIVFNSGGLLPLVSSELSDVNGASVPHMPLIGLVVFVTAVRNWPLYR